MADLTKKQKDVMRAIAMEKKGLKQKPTIEKVEEVEKREARKKADALRQAKANKVTRRILNKINKEHGTDFKLKKD